MDICEGIFIIILGIAALGTVLWYREMTGDIT